MNNNVHNMFACNCTKCAARYDAWCALPSAIQSDRKWEKYNNPTIKEEVAKRGYVTHADWLYSGHSLNETWGMFKAALEVA